MAAVPAGARIGKHIGTRVGQAQRVIQLAIGQQPGIGSDHAAAKLENQTPVEIEPQRTPVRFTRRVRHRRPAWSPTSCCIYRIISADALKMPPHPGNAGLMYTRCAGGSGVGKDERGPNGSRSEVSPRSSENLGRG